MTTGMAKSKKSPAEQAQPAGRPPVLNLRLGHELEAALAAYIGDQDVPPDKTTVVIVSVQNFLRERGYWPRPANEKE